MKEQGINEEYVHDVFNTGKKIKFASTGLDGVEKKFDHYGYLIGCVYKLSNANNEYVVLKTWKRKIG